MPDSSEDEIIYRKRQYNRKAQLSSDSVSSEDLVSASEEMGDFEPLFLEIFGNGEEYNYIYKDKKKNTEIELESKQKVIEHDISHSECYKYIKKIYNGFKTKFQGFTIECIRDLIEGYSPEYLGFHMNYMNVNELYYTKDLIDEYRKYNIHPNKSDKLDTYLAVINYKFDQLDIETSGILTISQYVQNLINFELMFLPRESIQLPFKISNAQQTEDSGWGDELPFLDYSTPIALNTGDKEKIKMFFKDLINQIANNPIFIDRVNKAKTIQIIEPENAETSIYSLNFLQKMFCSDSNGLDNLIRCFIVEQAFYSVNINKNEIEKKLINSGLIDGSLQKLVNIIVSLQGMTGSYAGCFYDKGLVTVVRIDEFGNMEKTAFFRDHQIQELENYLIDIKNVILTSTSQNVKNLMQNSNINFLYLPSKFALFNEWKELSVPYCIALAVQNPILYFSKVLYSLKNRTSIPLSSKFAAFTGVSLNDEELLKRAILTACSMHKIDWKNTLKHKFGYTFFNLIDIDLTDNDLYIENLKKLENLSQVFDTVKYSNVCTYFNLITSNNPLDRTFVHPNKYSMAVVICLGCYHKLVNERVDAISNFEKFDHVKDREKIIELIVNQPNLLETFRPRENFSESEQENLNRMKNILMRTNEVTFSGANDVQIFEDVVPKLQLDEIYTGTVSKTGEDFILCNVEDATVFSRKNNEFSTNQIVKVTIISKNCDKLSYEGSIVEEVKSNIDRFKTHPLFRGLDQSSLEKFMEVNSYTIGIRPSATPSHCVVVCKLAEGIYYQLKIREIYENSLENMKFAYEFKDVEYSSLDDFIDKYVKSIYLTLSKVFSFKYFFKKLQDAQGYLQEPGEYVKYCILLSKEAPGYLEFLSLNQKIYIRIDGPNLILKNYKFSSVDEMITYLKTNGRRQ